MASVTFGRPVEQPRARRFRCGLTGLSLGIILGLSCVLLPAPAAAEHHEAGPSDGPQAAGRERPERSPGKPWWRAEREKEKAAKLALSDTQMKKMDAIWTRHIEERRNLREAGREQQGEMWVAIQEGRFDEARAMSETIAQRMASSAMLLPSAKIEVFSVLSAAQRERFLAEFGEDAVRRRWARPDRPDPKMQLEKMRRRRLERAAERAKAPKDAER